MNGIIKSIASMFGIGTPKPRGFSLTKEEAARLDTDKDLQRRLKEATAGNSWIVDTAKPVASKIPGQTRPVATAKPVSKKITLDEEEMAELFVEAVKLGSQLEKEKAAKATAKKAPQAKRVNITPAKKAAPPAPVAPPKGEDVTAARAMAKYLHPKNVQQHLANAAAELSEKSRLKNMHPLVAAAENMKKKANTNLK